MKKALSVILTTALAVGALAAGAVGSSAAQLSATGAVGDQNNSCGFIDSNLRFAESLKVDRLEDIAIEVNGKPAYWNVGYLGEAHCKLANNGETEKAWCQIGIVGAAVTQGENTLKLTMGDSGDTYTQTFKAGFTSKGVAYSKVEIDTTAKTAEAVIVYDEPHGYKVGDEFSGRCHDDHNNTTTFKVTQVDGNRITLKAENYLTTKSLLELTDADGVFTTVTINTAKVSVSQPQALSDENTQKVLSQGKKQTLINGSTNGFGEHDSGWDQLVNGVGDNTGKLEGSFPGSITLTFETESAVNASYLVIYTGNDDERQSGRAPGAFVLSGSTDGKSYTPIKNVATSGMVTGTEGTNYKPFAFALKDAPAYRYYKLEILSTNGAGYFQIGELELYTGNVSLVGDIPSEEATVQVQQTEGFEYNGDASKAPTPETPPTQGGQSPDPDPDPDPDPENPPKTGSSVPLLCLIALIASSGASLIARKRRTARR